MTTESSPKPATNNETREPAPPTPPPAPPARRDFFGFADLRDEMDRLWEAMVSRRRPAGRPAFTFPQTPVVDVYEKDGELHVRAELPGLTEKDVEIEVTRGGITISGEKKEEHEVKEDNYYRSERSYGRFSRHIPLPERADVDKAEAKFKDGVLRIDMPIRPEEGRKKIEVKS